MCKTCGKAVSPKFVVFVFQASGFCPRRTYSLVAVFPECSVRGPTSAASLRTATICNSAGLSPIGAAGASEKCAKAGAAVHISCTTFPQRQPRRPEAETGLFGPILPEICKRQ